MSQIYLKEGGIYMVSLYKKSVLVLVTASIISTFNLEAASLPLKELYQLSSDFCEAASSQEYADQLKKDGWEDLQRVQWDASLSDIRQEMLTSDEIKPAADFDAENPNILKYDSARIYPPQHYVFVIASKEIEGNKVYVISFRGTADTYSWILTDFMAWPTQFLNTGTYVHSGFEWYRQSCNKNNALKAFLDKIKNDSNPCVLVTGHSLGAATAVLEGAYLIENKIVKTSDINVIPLAEPCPGRPDFVQRYQNSFNVYNWFGNNLDPVPVLPGLVGYSHFGNMMPFSLGPQDKVFDRHSLDFYREYLAELIK